MSWLPIFGLVVLFVGAGVFVALLVVARLLFGPRASSGSDEAETREMQDLYHTLDRMERRVERLEEALYRRMGTGEEKRAGAR